MPPSRVFISYSHDSAEHMARVYARSERLRRDGVDAWIDQYEPDPDVGWPTWIRRQIRQASGQQRRGHAKELLQGSGITNVREVTTAKTTEWLKEKKRARRSTQTLRSYGRDLRAWLPGLLDQRLVVNQPMPEVPVLMPNSAEMRPSAIITLMPDYKPR